ncbi:MAG: M28 family metallopeptidase [Gemmatimonadetes bacterium]|nr:M28 family metallopeptidase [Gemmatimonadota bacterium]
MPHQTRTLIAILGPLLWLAPPSQAQEAPMLGFTSESAEAQRQLEALFDEQMNRDNLREWMQRITSEPFYVGTPHNKENAEWVADLFREWGYDTEIVEYQVLFPKPRIREVEMVAPEYYRALLAEPVLDADATSGVDGRLPTYNAYSADGDVTGELVYVNQGTPDDYEELDRRGIDVRGKIVIARYGGSWRGIKPKVAHEHGALATILYSDPRDDGYFQGDVYPDGPYKMAQGVQRGSVMDMPVYPGDPLTPFVAATADAERMTVEESPTIMKIPVIPLSYSDALPLLRALTGPVAPQAWRGALPITYHLGPGPATVRVHLEFDWNLEPAYNVIARMEGSEYPDEWIIRGNHRDGWAMGAADPASGHVAMMEEARAIGVLARGGQRPKRTIVFTSWDAEEPGLIGSTEWVEHHADELREKAVAYINTDGSGRGFLNIGGSHTLERMANEVARDVEDPQTGVSVWQRTQARRAVSGNAEATTRPDLRISPLGSGSDYTPFLQHLGVASLNVSYGGENRGGSYHSQYDSFDHYTRFGDPGFYYGVTLAKTTGRMTLRLANADVLPMRFANFVDNVSLYVEEVIELLDETRTSTERENELVEMNAYVLAADPTQTYVPPTAKDEVPYLSFASLQNAMREIERSANTLDGEIRRVLESGLTRAQQADVNQVLISTERLMTNDEGLPRRPWFRHQIYAPGFYTGYGVKTLPGIREAIEQRNWEEASEQIELVADMLIRVSDALERAARILEGNEIAQ